MTRLWLVVTALFLTSRSPGMTQTPQVDAAPVCIATTMADVISIELTTPAQSATSGATDAVARTLETIHLSQHGPMLRADATVGRHIEFVDIGQRVGRAFCK